MFEVADSEDDELLDDSPNARRTRHDEEVARQLQEEYYREADGLNSHHHNEDDDLQDEDDEDTESQSEPDPKGKGKAVSRPRSRTTRAAVKSVVADLDEPEESSDAVEDEPPSKRQKKTAARGSASSAKGKGKMLALDPESEDDLPRKLIPNMIFLIPLEHPRLSDLSKNFHNPCFDSY